MISIAKWILTNRKFKRNIVWKADVDSWPMLNAAGTGPCVNRSYVLNPILSPLIEIEFNCLILENSRTALCIFGLLMASSFFTLVCLIIWLPMHSSSMRNENAINKEKST